jgi:hypothetical protein
VDGPAKSHAQTSAPTNGVSQISHLTIKSKPLLIPETVTIDPIDNTPNKPMGCGQVHLNGQANGARNGAVNGSTETTETKTTTTTTTIFHALRETSTTVVVQCKKELGAKAESVLTGTLDVDGLLEFIAAERLRSMPHQGSKWDKVLKWAESFARRVDVFACSISRFTDQSSEAAQLIWGGCKLLLQVCGYYDLGLR